MSDLVRWVVFLGIQGICYLGWSGVIRRIHRRERRCGNPLHRAEADQAAAVSQTALVLHMLGLAIAGTAVFLLPRWVQFGWLGLALGLIVGLGVTVGSWTWERRRTRQLGLSKSRCAP